MKRLKKSLSILLVFCFIVSSFTMAFAADHSDVKVKLDGKYITFDTKPCLIGGRTMVPLRAIFEALGASVDWDDATQTVTSYNEAYLVKCTIGENKMFVNNEIKMMDVPPMLVDGRTLVPARFVAEAFACKVDWDADNSTVIITSTEIDYSKLETSTDNTPTQHKPSVSTSQSNTTASSKGSLQNPYSANDGATIIYQEWSHYPQKQVSIKCTNVIRGTTANNLAHSENRYNDQPNGSQEWCFLEFDVKYFSASGEGDEALEGSDVIYQDTFFDANGAKLNVADMATLGDTYEGYGVFDTEFYPGSSGKVVIGILINKNVGDILLRVPNKTGGTNTWIKCTDGYTSSKTDNSVVSTNNNTPKTNTSTSYSFYSGTTIPTYTYVTGVALKRQDTLNDGSPLYMYRYTNSDDVGAYWKKLIDNGWRLFKGDDETTSDKFESCYVKGSQLLILNVYFDLNEVWITF